MAALRFEATISGHPNFVILGYDTQRPRDATRLIVYTRGPMDVPSEFDGYPVASIPIESVRFGVIAKGKWS